MLFFLLLTQIILYFIFLLLTQIILCFIFLLVNSATPNDEMNPNIWNLCDSPASSLLAFLLVFLMLPLPSTVNGEKLKIPWINVQGDGPWALCCDSESEQAWGSQRWQGWCLFLRTTNVSSRRVILNTPPLLTKLWQAGETCEATGQLNWRWRFVSERGEQLWQIQLDPELDQLGESLWQAPLNLLLLYLLLHPQGAQLVLVPPQHLCTPRGSISDLSSLICAGNTESLPWDGLQWSWRDQGHLKSLCSLFSSLWKVLCKPLS